MARYVLLAMNGPTSGEGDEDAYNQWYHEVHMPDLLATKGVVSAKRYKVVQSNTPWPYVAIYEIETDDITRTLEDIGKGMHPFPATFDRSRSGFITAVALDGP